MDKSSLLRASLPTSASDSSFPWCSVGSPFSDCFDVGANWHLRGRELILTGGKIDPPVSWNSDGGPPTGGGLVLPLRMGLNVLVPTICITAVIQSRSLSCRPLSLWLWLYM